MSKKHLILFWIITAALLTLLFSTSLDGLVLSFYFVTFLLPVAIGTSYFFNHFLVPRYLLIGRKMKFYLYFAYMLIVSIYLELLVMILAFVILADYQIANLGKIAGDIYLMVVILYLIVFGNGILIVFRKLQDKNKIIESLQEVEARNKLDTVQIRVDRKQVYVPLNEIIYVESLSDYVRIHTSDSPLVTKEKISVLERKLPTGFLRIHRSFIVNSEHVKSYNRESVTLENASLTIGRKYKKAVLEKLSL